MKPQKVRISLMDRSPKKLMSKVHKAKIKSQREIQLA